MDQDVSLVDVDALDRKWHLRGFHRVKRWFLPAAHGGHHLLDQEVRQCRVVETRVIEEQVGLSPFRVQSSANPQIVDSRKEVRHEFAEDRLRAHSELVEIDRGCPSQLRLTQLDLEALEAGMVLAAQLKGTVRI